MDFHAALAYLYAFQAFGIRPGLERITALLARLGHPEQKLSAMHIAGTNGKGSVSSFCAHIAAAEGKKVGWFTSPYLERYTERFRILNGRKDLALMQEKPEALEISETRYAQWMQRLQEAIQGMQEAGGEPPTVFEIETALAFAYFAEEGCELLVLETGLGGRLDSTNVLPASACQAVLITALGYDHCDRLGNKMDSIAMEKAGIIKKQAPVFLYDPALVLEKEEALMARRVVEDRCKAMESPLTIVGAQDFTSYAKEEGAQSFELEGDPLRYRIQMQGAYQRYNAALALAACRAWARPKARQEGLWAARWPGRLERLQDDPLVLIDGAHNPQGIDALARALQGMALEKKALFFCGMLGDKDHGAMLHNILKEAKIPLAAVFCTEVPIDRSFGAKALAEEASDLLKAGPPRPLQEAKARLEEAKGTGYNQPQVFYETGYREAIEEAYALSKALHCPLIVFGSLYLIGHLRGPLKALIDQKAP